MDPSARTSPRTNSGRQRTSFPNPDKKNSIATKFMLQNSIATDNLTRALELEVFSFSLRKGIPKEDQLNGECDSREFTGKCIELIED